MSNNEDGDDGDDDKVDMADTNDPHGAAQTLLFRLWRLATQLLTGQSHGLEAPSDYYLMRPGEKTPGGRTDNYRLMGHVGAWVFYKLAGAGAEAAAAETRKWVVDDLKAQASEFMLGEQCAPDPHHVMWASAHAVLWLAALTFGDAEMLTAVEKWWAAYWKIAETCHTTGNEVVVTCLNCRTSTPVQTMWNAMYRERHNLPQSRQVARAIRKGKLAEDRYFLPLWVARTKPALLAIDAAQSLPAMRHPMTVNKSEGGRAYVATITRNPGDRRVRTSWVCGSVKVAGNTWTSEKGWPN